MALVYDYKYTIKDYPPAYWFIFFGDEVLTEGTGDSPRIPFVKSIQDIGLPLDQIEYIGSMDGRDCYAASIKEPVTLPGFTFHKLLEVFGPLDETWFWLAGRAYHLLGWSLRTRFCSVCGSKMIVVPEERARQCTSCGARVYPRISPAIIVAITKGDKILLARGKRFTTPMYSVLAGFVEAGETLEECVHREVREEVGIEVKNIRYFGSQPWPFPDSLMVAFTAEYASGTITIDPHEIGEAGWYGVNELPQLPGRASVALKLINWFKKQYKG